MGKSQNSNEILAKKISQMGPDLGQLHYDLWGQLTWLFAGWQIYQDLFEMSEEQIKLFNGMAPRTFHFIQVATMHGVLLHLCRITDPIKSCGKENLTIQRILPLIEKIDVKNELQPLVETAVNNSSFAKNHRNKVVAHLDLDTFNTKDRATFKKITPENINLALDSIATVMDETEILYGGNTVLYSFSAKAHSDASSLVYFLQRGVDARRNEFDNWLK